MPRLRLLAAVLLVGFAVGSLPRSADARYRTYRVLHNSHNDATHGRYPGYATYQYRAAYAYGWFGVHSSKRSVHYGSYYGNSHGWRH